MKSLKTALIFVTVFLTVLLLEGCSGVVSPPQSGGSQLPSAEESVLQEKDLAHFDSLAEVNALFVYHWWASEGELGAINALSKVFLDKYPNTAAMIAPLVGGDGMKMIEKIKSMIYANEAPDSFVAHPGYEILPYVNEGLLKSLDDIWQDENLEKYIPEAVQDISKMNGRYYTIPIDIHRNNLVWFNKVLVEKNHIDVSSLKDWDSFFSACDKLRAAGIQYPIQMGEAWTATFVFHNIILSQGVDFYQDYINGKIVSENDLRMKNVLEIFKKYLSYVNPDSADIGWSEATNRIIRGEGAFNIIGDWANGDFKLIGMKFDADYGVFSVPGTDGLHLLVVDAFVKPEGILHPTSANNWLKTVVSREGQDAFNPKKGSISFRSDSDRSAYDDYQKSAMDYFQNSRLVIDTGSALPFEFRDEINNIIGDFVLHQNIDTTLGKITSLTKDLQDKYLITWSIK